LRYHSDGFVIEGDDVSIPSQEFYQHEAVHTAVAAVSDVLTYIVVLEAEEPQGDGALLVFKLQETRIQNEDFGGRGGGGYRRRDGLKGMCIPLWWL
jgi:hypothetical protein